MGPHVRFIRSDMYTKLNRLFVNTGKTKMNDSNFSVFYHSGRNGLQFARLHELQCWNG